MSRGTRLVIGLAVRGLRTVDDQLTVWRQRTGHVRTHLAADTVDRLGHAVAASYLDHRSRRSSSSVQISAAPRREDVLDSGSTPDHVESLEADVRAELDDPLAHR